MPLEKTDYTIADCNNAIESYKQSLKWYDDKPLTFDYAMTWYSIGLIYSKLMNIDYGNRYAFSNSSKSNYVKGSPIYIQVNFWHHEG
jgi:hypothetical protein